MKFKTNLKLLTAGVIFSSFTFAGNQEVDIEDRACLDKGACPKILELAKVGSLKADKVSSKSLNKNIISTNTISITNKSKKGVTTIIAANNQGKKTSCGQFSLAGKATITVNVSCDVSGSTYTLEDSDGRSNVLDITASTNPTPTPPPRDFLYAFITSGTFTGNLNGIEGASLKCQVAADNGIPALHNLNWEAWISAPGNDAVTRLLAGNTKPYRMANSVLLTPSLVVMTTSGSLSNLFQVTELDTIVASPNTSWTNTDPNGLDNTTTSGGNGCNGFTNGGNFSEGNIGQWTFTSGEWTNQAIESCDALAHLYCFEKITP